MNEKEALKLAVATIESLFSSIEQLNATTIGKMDYWSKFQRMSTLRILTELHKVLHLE